MEVSNKIYFEILALLFPLYLNRATMSPNPLERFKLVVTSIIGSYLWTNSFLKPVFYYYLNITLAKSCFGGNLGSHLQ
jgi:hypothetical protein